MLFWYQKIIVYYIRLQFAFWFKAVEYEKCVKTDSVTIPTMSGVQSNTYDLTYLECFVGTDLFQ